MANYKASDFFMTRVPLMSVNDYINLFDDQSLMSERLKKAFDSPVLREALAVASKDLFEAINSNRSESNKKTADQIRSSLLKYFIRMSTRPTPFGLFSGISIGRFGDESNITVSDLQHYTKRARLDMEWVYGLIKKIETNKNIRKNLGVRFNDFTYANGSRIEKPNKTFMQHVKERENTYELSTSIRYTGQVKAIEEKCMGFHLFSDILSEIAFQNPDVPISRIETFLSQMMENEFLLSELRPPLTNTDMLDYLIRILSKIKDIDDTNYILKLKQIQDAIAIYNATHLGEGTDVYNEIIRLQGELFECKNYLQIDLKVHTENNMLDNSLRDELNRFASAMVRLAASDVVADEMADYKDLFLERYGYDAEIPVLELLDVDKGIGAPMHHGVNTINRPISKRLRSSKEEKLNVLMERKMILALREGKNAIEITNADVGHVCENETQYNETKPMDYKQSFELYLLLHPGNSNKSGDEDYCFTISPMPMSDGFGKSFGRFSDMLSTEELSQLNEGFQKQKDLLPEYVIAEITELPSSGRTSNISINSSNYDYQISLTTNPCEDKHTLSIRDLYIGIDRDSNQFFVKSRSLQKRVIVTMTCMLNTAFGSNALRFLREVSTMRRIDVTKSIINVLDATKFEYTPRVTYGKIIIRPETWQISKGILSLEGAKKDDNKNAFDQVFSEHRITWKIPKFVFMNEGDNRLLLDLDNHAHRNEIYKAIKKDSSFPVKLTELGCGFEDYASVDANCNHYVTEIVVPFVLAEDNRNGTINAKDDKEVTKGTDAEASKNSEIFKTFSNISANRMKLNRNKLMLLPGDDRWLYYKLYGCSKRQDELIVVAHNSLEKIVTMGVAQKYFFIRYSDPEPHLRIRVQPVDKKTLELFAYISRWIDNLYADGIISRAVSDSYIRETERYGGPDLIEHVEDYFYSDSKLVMNLLTKHRFGVRFNEDIIGVSFIISVLEAFGLSIEEQEVVLNSQSDNKLYRKEFQDNRKMFMCAADSSDDWFEIRMLTQDSEVYNLINANSQELKKLAETIYNSDQQGELTNSIKGIAMSVIHMFCNRLMGNNAWERKIYALTRHSVRSLKGFLHHQQTTDTDLVVPESLI